MKIERLLAMIVYLLNHERVSARVLANRFEVSIRTIQRDIDTLTLAGIPIIAYTGVDGGYAIMDTYKAHVQLANKDDYQIVLAALQGFQSALSTTKIDDTLNKIQSMNLTTSGHLVLDFSVLKEKKEIHEHATILEKAIVEKRVLTFMYTNAHAIQSRKYVEPLAMIYKWYSWYLLAFDRETKTYRYYKLIRMEDLQTIEGTFQPTQYSMKNILQQMEEQDHRTYVTIKAIVQKDSRIKAIEYLPIQSEEILDNGNILMTMKVFMEEELWKGTLLSFASSIQIVEPMEVKQLLVERCQQFLNVNDDIELS